jgi:predicted acylesterase/phospholipase RssA
MRYERGTGVSGVAVLVILLAGCGAQPYALDARQSADVVFAPSRDPEMLVGLAVSGGGSRAATFTASVLEELARQIKLSDSARNRSFVEYINYISSVSGGSLATAYYGLNKPERNLPVLQGDGLSEPYAQFFRTFRADMEKSYEGSLFAAPFADATKHAVDLSESWDKSLFHDATFSDLYKREQRGDSPKLILNGTSWDSGRRFVFTTLPESEFSFDFTNEVLKDLNNRGGAAEDMSELRKQAQTDFNRFRPITFEEIKADQRNIHVSVAVAGSSSVPAIIGPVMFRVQGSGKKYHIGDGGLFDNQGIESIAQIFFKKLSEPATDGRTRRKALIVVIDASYPFMANDEELSKANSALDLLKIDPSRVSNIMEQRARSYQLLLWAHLRGTGAVVPNPQSLRIVYLRHTDVNEAIVRSFPKECGSLVEGAPTLDKVKVLLSRIPTRFEIKQCHASLLGAAAKNIVEANVPFIATFFAK